jgi:HPt (histidine-containing phosphotransfer) domain-containing protein
MFAEQQWLDLAQMLHKIKGAARLIDARQVVRSCEQQEKICKTGMPNSWDTAG